MKIIIVTGPEQQKNIYVFFYRLHLTMKKNDISGTIDVLESPGWCLQNGTILLLYHISVTFNMLILNFSERNRKMSFPPKTYILQSESDINMVSLLVPQFFHSGFKSYLCHKSHLHEP